jgi:hypothetical protein
MRIILSARIAALLALNADRVGVVLNTPGCDFNTSAAHEVELLRQDPKLFLCNVEPSALLILIDSTA